jgi:hypothetical protein
VEVKQAVTIAKNYIADLFQNEQMSDLGLEEVEYDEQGGEWLVTLGFSRPWERALGFMGAMQTPQQRRSYKTLRVNDKTEQVLSVKNRDPVR